MMHSLTYLFPHSCQWLAQYLKVSLVCMFLMLSSWSDKGYMFGKKIQRRHALLAPILSRNTSKTWFISQLPWISKAVHFLSIKNKKFYKCWLPFADLGWREKCRVNEHIIFCVQTVPGIIRTHPGLTTMTPNSLRSGQNSKGWQAKLFWQTKLKVDSLTRVASLQKAAPGPRKNCNSWTHVLKKLLVALNMFTTTPSSNVIWQTVSVPTSENACEGCPSPFPSLYFSQI